MGNEERYDKGEQALPGSTDYGGSFSYIRLGRPRSAGYTSSPTIANATGQYVWDFLNWGLTGTYVLEAFSKVTPNDTDIVPFASMDQGRLFVRVSVQDLASLQLAYQRGLTALQRAHVKIEQLKEDNQRLQSMVKNWSIKTTELTTETITLRQEIANLKHQTRTCFIPLSHHKELIELLCSNICTLIINPTATDGNQQGTSYYNLLKLIFSLPLQVHEKLANICPKFEQFLNSNDPQLLNRIRASEAEGSLRLLRITNLDGMPHAITLEAPKSPHIIGRRRSHDQEQPKTEVLKLNETGSSTSVTAPQMTQSYTSHEDEGRKPDLPPRRYSAPDLGGSKVAARKGMCLIEEVSQHTEEEEENNESKLVKSDGSDSPLYDNQVSCGTRNDTLQEETTLSKSKQENPTAIDNGRGSRSQSSSFGAPLAQSTPYGTFSTLVSPKHQVNPNPRRKRRKRKISRWNLAARICSSGRSATMSDSESMESAIYLHTNVPVTHVNRHHGRQPNKPKKRRWFLKKA